MNKLFKYLIALLVVCTLVGVFVALNMPRLKLILDDKKELSEIIAKLNADLPHEIGTIGSLDSILLIDNTIIEVISVKGGDKIMQVYSDNYDEFKDLLKYIFMVMNGQRNLGNTVANYLNTKELDFCFKVYAENNKYKSWRITGKELDEFVDSCKLSPTTALQKVIDMQIKIANLELPMTAAVSPQATTVALNSLVGDATDECYLLQTIQHNGNDILFEYKVCENEIQNIELLKEKQDDMDFMDAFVQKLAQDKDVLAFIGTLAMSHSNLVLIYHINGSKRKVSIKIPYTILRNHCDLPQNILSIN